MKTKLLCFIGGILLISGLFCACEKEPEVTIHYFLYSSTSIEEDSVRPGGTEEPTRLDTLFADFARSLSAKRKSWDVPAKRGQIAAEDEKARAEFHLCLPSVEARIAQYQEIFQTLGLPDGQCLHLGITYELYKIVSYTDAMMRYTTFSTQLDSLKFELKTE